MFERKMYELQPWSGEAVWVQTRSNNHPHCI